ncbi:uncharacterized protein LOC120342209 [Styela clava]
MCVVCAGHLHFVFGCKKFSCSLSNVQEDANKMFELLLSSAGRRKKLSSIQHERRKKTLSILLEAFLSARKRMVYFQVENAFIFYSMNINIRDITDFPYQGKGALFTEHSLSSIALLCFLK